MAFVHPVLGTLAILFSLWIMGRGLAARQRTPKAHAARRTHQRWAFWALGAMVVAAGSGIASTLALRPDLELGETAHLAVGLVVVALMAIGGLTTRYFTRVQRLRTLHPFIGMAAVLLAIAQAILGIELLP